MADASKDKRIVTLFTRGSHHRNLSVIYSVQNLFHQRKGNRSISQNSHYLVLFKNPREKLQILTMAKQMYPGQTDFFLNQCEEAVKKDLLVICWLIWRLLPKIIVDGQQTSCPVRKAFTKQGFKKIFLKSFEYLKQNLSPVPLFPAMQETIETIFGTMRKLSDTFSCKTDT